MNREKEDNCLLNLNKNLGASSCRLRLHFTSSYQIIVYLPAFMSWIIVQSLLLSRSWMIKVGAVREKIRFRRDLVKINIFIGPIPLFIYLFFNYSISYSVSFSLLKIKWLYHLILYTANQPYVVFWFYDATLQCAYYNLCISTINVCNGQ